jgi:hypothetical protein
MELAGGYASQERLPLSRGEAEDRAVRVLGIADADHAAQVRHLKAVAVGERPRRLDPGGFRVVGQGGDQAVVVQHGDSYVW